MVQALAEPDRRQFGGGALEGILGAGELQRHRDILQRRHGREQMKGLEYDPDMAAAESRQSVLVERG